MKLAILAAIIIIGSIIGFEVLLKIIIFFVMSVVGVPLSILLLALALVLIFKKKE